MWLQFIRRFSSMTLICRWGAWTPWRTRSRSSWRARWWSTWSTTSWASLRTLTSSRDRRVPKLLAYSTLCVVTRQGLTLGYSDATLLLFLSLLPEISWVICLSFSLSYRSKLHWQFKRREWLDHAGNGSWFNLELYSCHCCHGSPHTISKLFSSGFIGHFSVLRILIGQSLAVYSRMKDWKGTLEARTCESAKMIPKRWLVKLEFCRLHKTFCCHIIALILGTFIRLSLDITTSTNVCANGF